MFETILTTNLTIFSFLLCIVTSLILGLLIAWIHMKTSMYSKNFAITLSMLPALVATVIMMVNGNLGTSVAVLGAFSLIRFRSVPGNSKEIMNVFFAMAVGLACGTGYIGFAIVITLLLSLFTYLLFIIHFGENKKNHKILKIVIPEDLDYTTVFDDLFENYTTYATLYQSKTTNMGSMFELTYQIAFKNNISEKEFIDKIRCRNGNLKVSLSHPLLEQEL